MISLSRKYPVLWKTWQTAAHFLWNERSSAGWLKSFFGVAGGAAVLCFLLILWIDPYVAFHRAIGLQQVYDDAYATIPGLLRHFPYDSVMLGSSMCRNFRISEIDRLHHCRAIKATAPGMTGDDLGRLFQLLLTEKRSSLKRIFLGLDSWAFCSGPVNGHWRSRPYLYDHPFSWEYFFSADSVKAAANVIVTNLAPAGTRGADREKDFDRMFGEKYWRVTYSREEMEGTLERKIIYTMPIRPDTVALMEKFVLAPLKACPDLQVDIFLPPYSIYFWTMLHDHGFMEAYLDTRLKIAERVARCPHMRLHDFQHEPAIICQFDNYKDLTHYSPQISSRILAGMANRKYLADPARVRAGNDAIRQMVKLYYPRYREISSHAVSEMIWKIR